MSGSFRIKAQQTVIYLPRSPLKPTFNALKPQTRTEALALKLQTFKALKPSILMHRAAAPGSRQDVWQECRQGRHGAGEGGGAKGARWRQKGQFGRYLLLAPGRSLGAGKQPRSGCIRPLSTGSTHCLAQCGRKSCRTSSVSGHPVRWGNPVGI